VRRHFSGKRCARPCIATCILIPSRAKLPLDPQYASHQECMNESGTTGQGRQGTGLHRRA
jgi:hypothetical protein